MLSIIIPCYNEEKLVKKTFSEVLKAIKFCRIKNYEIIFIDDCSKDKSFEIVNKNFKNFKKIKIYKNEKNFGIGYNFYKGVSKSKERYLILIPSDNSHPATEISKIFQFLNSEYDIVTTYYSNSNERSLFRNLFTKIYTPLLNFLYGTNLPYFNGLTLYRSKDLKNLKFKNSSFSYQIEIFVYLFYKYNLKIKIVPTILKDRKKDSKAFRLKNSIFVVISIIKIFFNSIVYRISNFLNK